MMLETGQIGELKPDLSHSEVREIMGNPEKWTSGSIDVATSMDDAVMWKYGILVHHFGIQRIILKIYITHDSLPNNIQIQGFFPNSTTSLKEFEEFLGQNQVEAKFHNILTFGRNATLMIGKNIIVFVDNLFHSIQLNTNSPF
jgi:hypothetical protein